MTLSALAIYTVNGILAEVLFHALFNRKSGPVFLSSSTSTPVQIKDKAGQKLSPLSLAFSNCPLGLGIIDYTEFHGSSELSPVFKGSGLVTCLCLTQFFWRSYYTEN